MNDCCCKMPECGHPLTDEKLEEMSDRDRKAENWPHGIEAAMAVADRHLLIGEVKRLRKE